MAAEITDDKVRELISVWKEVRGDRLSYSKAKRRLEDAVEMGCPLLDDCSKCGIVGECPILNLSA